MKTMESRDPRHTDARDVARRMQGDPRYLSPSKLVVQMCAIQQWDWSQWHFAVGGVCHDLAADPYLFFFFPLPPFFYDDTKENKSQPLLLSLATWRRHLPKDPQHYRWLNVDGHWWTSRSQSKSILGHEVSSRARYLQRRMRASYDSLLCVTVTFGLWLFNGATPTTAW